MTVDSTRAPHTNKIWEGVLALFVADVVQPSALESPGDWDLSRQCSKIGWVRILEIGCFHRIRFTWLISQSKISSTFEFDGN
jgi:hypothetical protein